MTGQRLSLAARITADGITADAAFGAPDNDTFTNATGWTVTLSRRDSDDTITVPFYMGSAHGTTPPTVAYVLSALLSDAAGVDNADGDFEKWCGEYGYDTDSRRAERTFKAAKEQTADLRDFLGDLYGDYVWETDEQDKRAGCSWYGCGVKATDVRLADPGAQSAAVIRLCPVHKAAFDAEWTA